MENEFFIMLYSQSGRYASPIVDEADNVVFYPTADACHEAMADHPCAQAFGYEIHCMGLGES